MIITKNNWNFF